MFFPTGKQDKYAGAGNPFQVIGAEKTARADYLALAESAKDKSVKDFFKKIADEEDGHRRILEDQFLTLTNSGRWTWAE